jgi:Phage integrase family
MSSFFLLSISIFSVIGVGLAATRTRLVTPGALGRRAPAKQPQSPKTTTPMNFRWPGAALQESGPRSLPQDMRSINQPVAKRIGIKPRIGWHTFRHTFSSLLRATRADIKVMQELLRHASSRVTLDTYTQAVTPHKRKAQSDVIRLMRAAGSVAAEAASSAVVPICAHV